MDDLLGFFLVYECDSVLTDVIIKVMCGLVTFTCTAL